MGTTGLLTPGVAVAKETKKDIVDRQEARDKASAMSSHRRILAWEKDVRTKNATQLAILAYVLVHNHTTKHNKTSAFQVCQLWPIPILRAADWMWLTPRCIEMGCRTPHRLGWSGRKGRITWKPWSMTRWEAGEAISLRGKLWWGEAQQGWNIMECHGKYM